MNLDRCHRVADVLKQIALALCARAACDQRAGTIRLSGPWRLPRLRLQRFGPIRHIEQRPDVAEIVGQRVGLKVERLKNVGSSLPPASSKRTLTSTLSANRRATTGPDDPEPQTIKS